MPPRSATSRRSSNRLWKGNFDQICCHKWHPENQNKKAESWATKQDEKVHADLTRYRRTDKDVSFDGCGMAHVAFETSHAKMCGRIIDANFDE